MESPEVMDVRVLCVRNAGEFVGLATGESEANAEFVSLSNYVNEFYKDEKPMATQIQSPDPDQIYCVKSKDGHWHRTRVQMVFSTQAGSLAKCELIDCSRTEDINLRWLRECPPDFRMLPTQSKTYRLYGIQPVTLKTSLEDFTTTKQPTTDWDIAADIFVKEKLTKERTVVKVEVIKVDQSGVIHVRVYLAQAEGFECLNDILVEEEYGIHTETTYKGHVITVEIPQAESTCKGDLGRIFENYQGDLLPQHTDAAKPPLAPVSRPQTVQQQITPSSPSTAQNREKDLSEIFHKVLKSSPITSDDGAPVLQRRRTPGKSRNSPAHKQQVDDTARLALTGETVQKLSSQNLMTSGNLARTGDVRSIPLQRNTPFDSPSFALSGDVTPKIPLSDGNSYEPKNLAQSVFCTSDSGQNLNNAVKFDQPGRMKTEIVRAKDTLPVRSSGLGRGHLALGLDKTKQIIPPGPPRVVPSESLEKRPEEDQSIPGQPPMLGVPTLHNPPEIQRMANLNMFPSSLASAEPSVRQIPAGRGRGFAMFNQSAGMARLQSPPRQISKPSASDALGRASILHRDASPVQSQVTKTRMPGSLPVLPSPPWQSSITNTSDISSKASVSYRDTSPVQSLVSRSRIPGSPVRFPSPAMRNSIPNASSAVSKASVSCRDVSPVQNLVPKMRMPCPPVIPAQQSPAIPKQSEAAAATCTSVPQVSQNIVTSSAESSVSAPPKPSGQSSTELDSALLTLTQTLAKIIPAVQQGPSATAAAQIDAILNITKYVGVINQCNKENAPSVTQSKAGQEEESSSQDLTSVTQDIETPGPEEHPRLEQSAQIPQEQKTKDQTSQIQLGAWGSGRTQPSVSNYPLKLPAEQAPEAYLAQGNIEPSIQVPNRDPIAKEALRDSSAGPLDLGHQGVGKIIHPSVPSAQVEFPSLNKTVNNNTLTSRAECRPSLVEKVQPSSRTQTQVPNRTAGDILSGQSDTADKEARPMEEKNLTNLLSMLRPNVSSPKQNDSKEISVQPTSGAAQPVSVSDVTNDDFETTASFVSRPGSDIVQRQGRDFVQEPESVKKKTEQSADSPGTSLQTSSARDTSPQNMSARDPGLETVLANLRPSANMVSTKLSPTFDKTLNVPSLSGLSLQIGSEEERKSGSDSGSGSTGPKLMSRLPKAAFKKKEPYTMPMFSTELPIEMPEIKRITTTPRSDSDEKPLKSILKKKSPSSVYFSDSDKENTTVKRVELCVPDIIQEAAAAADDSDNETDLVRSAVNRECSRGRRLLEMMDPEHYERQYLKMVLSLSGSEFDSIVANDSDVMVDGEMIPKPVYSLENSHLAEFIKNKLSGMNFPLPTKIQSYAWPAILRGLNVIGIAPPKRGKTLAYMAPLATLLLQKNSYQNLKPGSGPIAVVLTSSWKNAWVAYDLCKSLVGSTVKTKLIYGGGDEDVMSVDVINGCDMLIATPHCLNRMLKKEYLDFDRLCHLVLDDADVLTEDFTEEIRVILSAYNKALEENLDRDAPHQMVLFSSQWTAGIRSFQNKCMVNPLVILTSNYEAAVYGEVKQIPHVCHADLRFQLIPGILQSIGDEHEKILIFTNTPKDADQIAELLKTYSFNVLLYTHAMLTSDLDRIKQEWRQDHRPESKPILVMTDGGIGELQIADASCVIHYAMSQNKTKFGNRLGCMSNYLKKIDQENKKECVSHILLSPDCSRQAPTLLRLLKRVGAESIPRNLELLAAGAMEGREEGKQQQLCHYLKAFGRCRDMNKCPARHIVSADLDQPDSKIPMPTSGEVKVFITHVVNATHYFARIQEHRQFSGADGKVTTCRSYENDMAVLHFEVLKYFQEKSRRIPELNPVVDQLCAMDDHTGVYSRVKVLKVPRKLEEKSEIEVIYLDEGKTESVRLKDLYKLPDHLNLDAIPPQVVELYICGVKPKDEDIEWTMKASWFVYERIYGQELHGTIVLSLGQTLWLDSLYEMTYLSSLKQVINQFSIRKELLLEGHAVANQEHSKDLYKLCKDKVAIPIITVPKKEGITKYTYAGVASITTEILLETEKYHDVCASAIHTPHLFFVQKRANLNKIEDMCDKMNEEEKALDHVDPEMITSGMLCLAKFSQTDSWYRAQVLAMKDKKYEVFFVDYGDKEYVKLDDLRCLPDKYTALPLQAIECSLVRVSPVDKHWSDAAGDAFWDMCHDDEDFKRTLVAKVLSRSEAAFGMHKYHIELYDTSHDEELVFSRELVTAGHAVTTPESVQDLFPKLDLDVEPNEESEKIPYVCARMYLSKIASDTIQLAQYVKDIVNKHDREVLLKNQSHLAICKVVTLLLESSSQYLLLQALSVLLEDDRAREEVYNDGGLRVFCRILSKDTSTLSQLEVAHILDDFAFEPRYCYAVGYYGGLKHLCALADSVKHEHCTADFMRTLLHLCEGCAQNCEILKTSGSIRVLSRLMTRDDRREMVELILQLFTLLVNNLESTDAMRKDGAIEALCMNLARTAHVQLIPNIVKLLTTLSSHSRANKQAMVADDITDALEKYCRKNSRYSEDIREKCQNLYKIFVPTGYVDPQQRPVVTQPKVTESPKSLTPSPRIEELRIPTKRVCAEVLWSQKVHYVVLNIRVANVKRYHMDFTEEGMIFRAVVEDTEYSLELNLFQKIIPSQCQKKVLGGCVMIGLRKLEKSRWPRLIKGRAKVCYIKTDVDRYVNSSSESENEDPDESPFVLKRRRTIGEILNNQPSSGISKYLNARPAPLHAEKSDSSESEYMSDEGDSSVMRWAEKDPFNIFGP